MKINRFHRQLLGAAGIVGAVSGMTLMVLSILKESYIAASFSGGLAMVGIILISISLAD